MTAIATPPAKAKDPCTCGAGEGNPHRFACPVARKALASIRRLNAEADARHVGTAIDLTEYYRSEQDPRP